MRIKKIALFVSCLFIFSGIIAQPRIPPVKKKFFTLRNARLNVGINLSTNFTSQNDKNERNNIFNFYTNDLSQDYDVDFTQDDYPYAIGGILFDLFSPNSVLGFSFGAEYNFLNYRFESNNSTVASIRTQQVRFPAYLKFQTGTVHNRISGVLMGGGYYNLPLTYERNGPNGNSKNLDELNEFIGASVILGIQNRFFNNSDQSAEDVKYSRIWIYLRGDYALLDSSLSAIALQEILQSPNNVNQTYTFNPLNISIGVGYFF